MTRSEQAAFRGLDKRRHEMFLALGIINAWIQIGANMGDDPKEILYRIAEFAHGKIESEKWAAQREFERGVWKERA